uniref:Uncharacterized protein n=1 Tax=viral metagenome TaxID=1070528 RepID=A0A6H2A096_9ZZZZ
MERCMGQFIEFLKPYEGKGFGTDELRMATDSPEWAKEELISRLNQRHEGLTERLRENGLGISTYRGESGEKRFIVESA